MIWSIIRLIVARRMLKVARWLLSAGTSILDEESAKAAAGRRI